MAAGLLERPAGNNSNTRILDGHCVAALLRCHRSGTEVGAIAAGTGCQSGGYMLRPTAEWPAGPANAKRAGPLQPLVLPPQNKALGEGP
jgi:hypothetical protein